MKELCAAMAKAFPEIEGATKDSNNPHFKTKYADLSNVVEAIKPALTKHGLFFAQRTKEMSGGVCVETVVYHSSGESLSFGELFVPASKQDAQGYGSALTYARRYSLMAAFGVAPEDDDGNAAAANPPRQDERKEPEKRAEKWTDGPYSGKSQLHAACMNFSREIAGCGDMDMLTIFEASDEWKAFVKQAENRAPHYLYGGDPAPAEFVGLFDLLRKTRDELQLSEAA